MSIQVEAHHLHFSKGKGFLFEPKHTDGTPNSEHAEIAVEVAVPRNMCGGADAEQSLRRIREWTLIRQQTVAGHLRRRFTGTDGSW
jgi:hypothetical protein